MSEQPPDVLSCFSSGEVFIAGSLFFGVVTQQLGGVEHLGTRILLAVCIGGLFVMAGLLARS